MSFPVQSQNKVFIVYFGKCADRTNDKVTVKKVQC